MLNKINLILQGNFIKGGNVIFMQTPKEKLEKTKQLYLERTME